MYNTRDKKKYIIKIQKNIKGHLVRRKITPYKYIKYYYNNYLKKFGCKLPKENSIYGKALEFLYINIKKEVNIEDIRKYVKDRINLNEKVGDSLQVRHLGIQYGFNLYKNNEIMNEIKNKKIIKKSNYYLSNLTSIHNNFFKDKRKSILDKISWNNLKKDYDFKCASCGNEENKFSRFNKNMIVILEQGHMDPRKSLTLDNTIPQCQYCNKVYKNKAIFNKKGIVIAFNKKGF